LAVKSLDAANNVTIEVIEAVAITGNSLDLIAI
jgi:hypothetical protein